MTCQIWNIFFDWAWPPLALGLIAWVILDTLKQRWSIAANLRFAAGLLLAGTVVVLLASAAINSGVRSPCREAGDKVERIHRLP